MTLGQVRRIGRWSDLRLSKFRLGFAALSTPYAPGAPFDIAARYDVAAMVAGVTVMCAAVVAIRMPSPGN